jgi:NAD(P)-dependent dehydrogenase (short-subunit alcohol dehydrogenase family)
MAQPGQTRFGPNTTAAQVLHGHDLHGVEAIVTGTSGLGEATAGALAQAGARVLIAGRNRQAGAAVVDRIRRDSGDDTVTFGELDLASLDSVLEFTERFTATGRALDLLVANAGVMATPLLRTADGFELQFGTNHLGHFMLTKGLLPALRAAGRARVVVLSSRAHRRSDVDFDDPNYLRRPYDPWESYGQSKTANALFAVELTRRYGDAGILANSVMPGGVMTDLMRHIGTSERIARGWADADGNPVTPADWKTVEQGAATSVWAAVAPELADRGGLYLEDCAVAEPWTTDEEPPNGYYLPRILDPHRAQRLWDLSEQLAAR